MCDQHYEIKCYAMKSNFTNSQILKNSAYFTKKIFFPFFHQKFHIFLLFGQIWTKLNKEVMMEGTVPHFKIFLDITGEEKKKKNRVNFVFETFLYDKKN